MHRLVDLSDRARRRIGLYLGKFVRLRLKALNLEHGEVLTQFQFNPKGAPFDKASALYRTSGTTS